MMSRLFAFLVVIGALALVETAALWVGDVPVLRDWQWGRIQAAGRIIIALIGLLLVTGSFRAAYREAGISRNPLPAIVFALLATAPLWATLAATVPLNDRLDGNRIVLFDVLFPFSEEFFYRGFAFGLLFRRARLGFWLCALIPAAAIAAGQLYQAASLESAGMPVALTALGGILFCWLFMKWNFNLWVPVAMSVAMNMWWDVFAVGEGDFAGWMPALLRLASWAAAIALTLIAARTGLLRARVK
ncbi:MAG: CPBP family glutamic-type intramembrane protease [Alphaproteobacteria bacterium]